MQSKRLDAGNDARTFALVFGTGEEVTDGLLHFARAHRLSAARLSALGAFQEATLGFFDVDEKAYEEIAVEEQTEVLSLTGNIALYDEEPRLHAHVVLGRRDGAALGGHLIRGFVRPTLEVMLVETPAALQRVVDDATGLPLLQL